MKIEAITRQGTLPTGTVTVAAVSNKTAKTKKVQTLLNTIPNGAARGRSLCSQTNTVILLEDAIRHSIPRIAVKTFTL